MESMCKEDRKKAWRLLEAAECGDLETLKTMAKDLARGKGLKETIASIHDKLGETALHLAARKGKQEILEYLIENLGFDPNFRSSSGFKFKGKALSDITPLICSTLHNRVSTMEYLIKMGADLNARDGCDLTPLHIAAIIGRVLEALNVLVSHGAEVDAHHSLGTPLLLAAGQDNFTMLSILLYHKANPDYMHHNQFTAPLAGSVLQLLINPDYLMYDRFVTPLSVAARNGSMKCTELLIKAGADVNKLPVLNVALGSVNLVNYLLQSGADPNIPNKYGVFPIEAAAIRGLTEAVQILFPLTSPIKTVPDWTIEGLFNYVESQSFANKVKMARLKHAIKEEESRKGNTTEVALQEQKETKEFQKKKGKKETKYLAPIEEEKKNKELIKKKGKKKTSKMVKEEEDYVLLMNTLNFMNKRAVAVDF